MAKRVMKWDVDMVSGSMVVVVDGMDVPLTVECADIDSGFDGLSEVGRATFVNGAKQKIADSAAGMDTANDKRDMMEQTIESLLNGRWVAPKKAAARANDLAEAVAVVKDLSLDDATEKVLAVGKDIWAQWEKHPAIKRELAGIDARRAAEKADRLAESVDGEDEFEFEV